MRRGEGMAGSMQTTAMETTALRRRPWREASSGRSMGQPAALGRAGHLLRARRRAGRARLQAELWEHSLRLVGGGERRGMEERGDIELWRPPLVPSASASIRSGRKTP